MRLTRAFGKLIGGPTWDLDRKNERQQAQLLDYPLEREFDGVLVTMRSIEARDLEAILAFGRSLPERDLLFLRRDITRSENVVAWLRDVAEGRYVSVVVMRGTELVGYATVAQDQMDWTRHVAELRILVSPTMRGKGLGRFLAEQAFAIARERGIRKMVAQMTSDQPAAVRAFSQLGFEREATLRGQVMDRDGGLHDLEVMALDLAAFKLKRDTAALLAVGSTLDN
jgi:L-amino acid N-acyltransferase YncA